MIRRERQRETGAEGTALAAVGRCCARSEKGRVRTRRMRVNGDALATFPAGRDLQEGRNTRILLSRRLASADEDP
jgi:hypothetical protein